MIRDKATTAKGLALRPGSTAANVKVPTLNTREAYRQKSQEIIQQMIKLGLPES